MRVVVRGVKLYRSKGRIYCYHRATGRRILSALGTPEFFAEVESASKTSAAIVARPGTLGMLLAIYRASEQFRALAPRTQADYQRVMDWLAPIDGMALAMIDPPAAVKIRDKAQTDHKFRFANYVLSVLSAALTWGAERGHIKENAIKGKVKKVRRPRHLPEQNRPWTTGERETVLGLAPIHLKVPLALMRWAGLRTGDALALPKSAFDGTAIEVRTSKTGQLVWLPCPRPLRTILATAKLVGKRDTLASTSHDTPWTGNGFRASLAKFLKRLEREGKVSPGLSPHGLRHSVAVDLREIGYDERTIADFLGQAEIETARGYARGSDLRKKMTAVVKKLDSRRNSRDAS